MKNYIFSGRTGNLISKSLLLSLVFLFQCNSSVEDRNHVEVKIDISKTGPPIEKYIYGQFIEHLGKCIYGGIWAEMIEDRKFYYPIAWQFDPWGVDSDSYWNTGDYTYLKASPWQVIGKESTVKMEEKNSFTGKYTPVISATDESPVFGIKQGGIGFLTGQTYVGRIILSGDKSVLPITIKCTSGTGEEMETQISEITNDFQAYPFELKSTFSSDSASIEIFSKGKGTFKIGTISLMPSNNIKGWRRDVVALMKELNAPVYRWPGGNFVSGYNWRDGIGNRDKRPPRKNPAWKGVEHNDVGIHEYMELMEILNAEPFIAVNTGLGTVQEVAEEIEYCNGESDTPMGKLREQNGHKESYNVTWWAVGNEMYGDWQLGHIPLSEYVEKHNAMAAAIWEKDPEAKLIAVGAVGEWSETMLSMASDNMNLLSEHIYVKELEDVKAHTEQLKNSIKQVADAHIKYRKEIPGLEGKDIRIAMDEWNYWYGDYIYGELGVRYHHKDALGVAMGLHEYFRNSGIFFMANYAQTVNVIGCIKTTPTAAGFATTGLPLKLYRNHFERIPLQVEAVSRNLDIAASINDQKNRITISVVNNSPGQETALFNTGDLKLAGEVNQWTIQQADPESFNIPGQDPEVKIVEKMIQKSKKGYDIPAYSIVLFAFEIIQ